MAEKAIHFAAAIYEVINNEFRLFRYQSLGGEISRGASRA